MLACNSGSPNVVLRIELKVTHGLPDIAIGIDVPLSASDDVDRRAEN
jgi:hypothetical protein